MISLALLIVAGATADTGCEGSCSSQANRCYAQSVGADHSTARCGVRQNECIATCDRDRTRRKDVRRDKKSSPCGASSTGVARPCSDKERAANKKALTSPQAKSLLCKDAGGNYTPCKGDLEFAQAQFDKQLSKCSATGNKGPECQTTGL